MGRPCRFQAGIATGVTKTTTTTTSTTSTNDANCVTKGVYRADRAYMIPLSTEKESVGRPCRFHARVATGATHTTTTTTTTSTNDANCVTKGVYRADRAYMIPLSTENESVGRPCRFHARIATGATHTTTTTTTTYTNDANCITKGVYRADRAYMIPLSTENESVGRPCRFQARIATGSPTISCRSNFSDIGTAFSSQSFCRGFRV